MQILLPRTLLKRLSCGLLAVVLASCGGDDETTAGAPDAAPVPDAGPLPVGTATLNGVTHDIGSAILLFTEPGEPELVAVSGFDLTCDGVAPRRSSVPIPRTDSIAGGIGILLEWVPSDGAGYVLWQSRLVCDEDPSRCVVGGGESDQYTQVAHAGRLQKEFANCSPPTPSGSDVTIDCVLDYSDLEDGFTASFQLTAEVCD